MSSLVIGIDFDNTIAIYDELFHKCALEQELILPEMPKIKRVIRDHIRQLPNGEERWIILQAIVYGQRMDEAKMAENFDRFLFWAKEREHQVYIISHKSQYPSKGPQIDLRVSALHWMEQQRFFSNDGFNLDASNNVYFESIRWEKLNRIKTKKCSHFIDDLEEVLFDPRFPEHVERIHYSREVLKQSSISSFVNWNEILNMFQNL